MQKMSSESNLIKLFGVGSEVSLFMICWILQYEQPFHVEYLLQTLQLFAKQFQ